MAQKKKVRLADIAKELNISTVTVSKALSNKEGVGEDLRKKIADLAEEMGYKSTKSNSYGNGKITGNIGILIPSRFFAPNFSYYWYIFNYLSTELLHRNFYGIMELLSDSDEEKCTLPKMLSDSKVDAVIILGQVSMDYIKSIEAATYKFILLDFYTNDFNFDSVVNDDYYCSYILTSYVISQGHKKLQFVGNFDATTSIRDRFMGFQKAMLENNLDSSPDKIINDRDSKGGHLDLKLPEKNDMPTAFICNCDLTAANLIAELENRGYKVPEDISVTGFDNYLEPGKISVPLTTIYIKPEDIASVAVDVVVKKVLGEPYLKGRHLVSGSMIIRDSVKKLN